MRKLLLYATLLGLLIVGIAVYNVQNNINLTAKKDAPIRLRIPALYIDAPVINVGKTSSGQMDAPTSQVVNSPYWTSVFWYEPGAAPGQNGNAVIAGHTDRAGGGPAIFWSLNSLKLGNQIFVQTSEKRTLTFVVDRIVSYPANSPGQEALNAVFGSTQGSHLNLITCSGVWTNGGFDQRLVVFTTLVT